MYRMHYTEVEGNAAARKSSMSPGFAPCQRYIVSTFAYLIYINRCLLQVTVSAHIVNNSLLRTDVQKTQVGNLLLYLHNVYSLDSDSLNK